MPIPFKKPKQFKTPGSIEYTDAGAIKYGAVDEAKGAQAQQFFKKGTPKYSSLVGAPKGAAAIGTGAPKGMAVTEGKQQFTGTGKLTDEAQKAPDWEVPQDQVPPDVVETPKDQVDPGVVVGAEKLTAAAEALQKSFKQLESILGEQKDAFLQQMEKIQKQTGMELDVSQPGLLGQVQEAVQLGQKDFEPIISQFMKPSDQVTPAEPAAKGERIEDTLEAAKQGALAAGLTESQVKSAETAFQQGILDANELMTYFKKQAGVKEEPIDPTPTAEEPTSKPPEPSYGEGYQSDVVPEASPTEQAGAALENMGSMSGDSIMSMLSNAGYDPAAMTSSEMMQVMLLQQSVAAINDPTIANFLNNSLTKAAQAFDSAVQTYGTGGTAIKEINKAIDSQDFIPTTYEGLSAKVYKQSQEMQFENIQLEKKFLTEQYDAWHAQEQDKRSRLEGYLKAKLYAAGAQDSSAGLATMALAVNAADLRMQMKQSEYHYGISKLNIEAKGIMQDFTNNIVKLNLDTQNKMAEAEKVFQEKEAEVQKQFILNEKEKQKMTLDALGAFTDKMYQIEQDKKAEAQFWYQQKYSEIQDSIKNAYNLSGQTGTIHYVDKEGKIVDSGVQTFDAKKWEDSYWLDIANYERNVSNDSWGKAMNLLEGGLDTAAAKILGLPAGYFDGFETLADKEFALKGYKAKSEVVQSIIYDVAGTNGLIGGMFGEGTYETGAYGPLQCGEFMHRFVTDYPYNLNTLEQKVAAINSDIPEVGSIVITDESTTWGHVAIINKINPDGTMQLTEANYADSGMITNTRVISVNDPKIMGYFKGTLTPEIQGAYKSYTDAQVEKYVGYIVDQGMAIDDVKDFMGENISDSDLHDKVMAAFNEAITSTKVPITKEVAEAAVEALGAPSYLKEILVGLPINKAESIFEKYGEGAEGDDDMLI